MEKQFVPQTLEGSRRQHLTESKGGNRGSGWSARAMLSPSCLVTSILSQEIPFPGQVAAYWAHHFFQGHRKLAEVPGALALPVPLKMPSVLTRVGKLRFHLQLQCASQTGHGLFGRHSGQSLAWMEYTFPSGYSVVGFKGNEARSVGRQGFFLVLSLFLFQYRLTAVWL